MTRDEIRLVVFVLMALAVGTAVKWWRGPDAGQLPPVPAAEPKKSGWANPPYVFKTRAEMERIKEATDAEQTRAAKDSAREN